MPKITWQINIKKWELGHPPLPLPLLSGKNSHFSPFFLKDCVPNQGQEPWLLRVLTRWVDKMDKLLPATVRLPENIYSHHISCPTDPMKKSLLFVIPFFKQHKACLLPWEHESQPLVANHSLLLLPLPSCLNLTKICCHLWAIGQPKSRPFCTRYKSDL